jgi:hypothetical protein
MFNSGLYKSPERAKLKREVIGNPRAMHSFASGVLESAGGKRDIARRAIMSRYPTEVANKSGLCNDLNSEMYKQELYEVALSLSIPITKRTSKSELCHMIAKYIEESEVPLPEDTDEEVALKNLQNELIVENKWQNAVDEYDAKIFAKPIYELANEFGERAFPKGFADLVTANQYWEQQPLKDIKLWQLIEGYQGRSLPSVPSNLRAAYAPTKDVLTDHEWELLHKFLQFLSAQMRNYTLPANYFQYLD